MSPIRGIVGKIMTVAPEGTSQRCVWGSGNITHSFIGQKAFPKRVGCRQS